MSQHDGSAKISPYQIEAEEREHGTGPEDVHVLRTASVPALRI